MPIDETIQDIIHKMSAGGVILHPTDTVWGLGADSHSKEGIDKIYRIKKRPKNKPLLLLVNSMKMLKTHVPHIHPKIETLLHFHSRPLTVIYQKVKNLPSFAMAEDGSCGIRIVKEPRCKEIITALGRPMVSTSANIQGQQFARKWEDVDSSIIGQVDIIDLSDISHSTGKPSIIISYNEQGDIIFLRE